jgi:hypothetical protein
MVRHNWTKRQFVQILHELKLVGGTRTTDDFSVVREEGTPGPATKTSSRFFAKTKRIPTDPKEISFAR